MVRQESVMFQNLNIRNASVHQNRLSNVGASQTAGNTHFLASGKASLHHHGNATGKEQRNEQNSHIKGIKHHIITSLLLSTEPHVLSNLSTLNVQKLHIASLQRGIVTNSGKNQT